MTRFFIFLLVPFFCISQKLFVENPAISFFSSAPLEDITAVSNMLEGVVDFDSGEFFFRIPINSFVFPSSLMQKHFNEKYLESELYPMSTFKGKINQPLSNLNDTVLSINSKGLIDIHGVQKNISIPVDLNISSHNISFNSVFDIYLKDFRIKVPKIVRMNIADTVLVNVSGQLIRIK